jgi:hypothetical protein
MMAVFYGPTSYLPMLLTIPANEKQGLSCFIKKAEKQADDE